MNHIPQPDKPGIYYYQAPGERAPVKVLVFRRDGDLYLSLRREGLPMMMRDTDYRADWFVDPADAELNGHRTPADQLLANMGGVTSTSLQGPGLRLFVDGVPSA